MELTPVLDLMSRFPAPWWIGGGWAIDLAAGGEPREHDDVDVVVLRRDYTSLVDHLAGWRLDAVSAHELHATQDGFAVEFLLDDAAGGTWRFRRDRRVERPIASLGRDHVIAPEVALLFKAKRTGAKDERDFERALPLLDVEARAWLRAALDVAHPGHPWLERLA